MMIEPVYDRTCTGIFMMLEPVYDRTCTGIFMMLEPMKTIKLLTAEA